MKALFASSILFALLFAPRLVRAGQGPLQGSCIDTAIGCIDIGSESGLFTFILGWAMGIAGGVAFILIIVAGFMYITSAGDPKKVQAAKELLGAAIGGLLLLIFSAFILRVIGVNILGIL